MRRKIKEFISLGALKHLFYIPFIIFKIKNWWPFLLTYLGFKNGANIYKFRNGLQIKTNKGIEVTPIVETFIKKEYGKIKDDSIIIDIGANLGAFSIFAVSTLQNTKVYAYEPVPESYDLLLENIKLNKFNEKILPFKLGVGAKKEKRKLFLPAGGSIFCSFYSDKNNEEFLEINIISLKDIFDENKIEHCDLLKSDCEGAEFEIFYNTPDRYFEKIKEIRLEYHNQKGENYNIKSLINFLEKRKFHLTYFKKFSKHHGLAWFNGRKMDLSLFLDYAII